MGSGNYTEDATLNFKFNTQGLDQAPITLVDGVVSVSKGNNTTKTTAGVTLTTDFNGINGQHNVQIDLSADAFYAVGNDYQVELTAGTVDGISVVGKVLASFSIENRFNEVDVTKISGDATAADNCESMFDGTGYAGGTIKLEADLKSILGTALTETSAGYLAAALKKFLDVAVPVFTAANVNQGADNNVLLSSATVGLANLKTLIDAANTILASGTYGNSALLTAIQNVQNGTFVSATIPQTIEKPDTGSVTVPIVFAFADETGAAKNLDSGNPAITLVNDAGTDLSGRLGSWTNPATGKYVINYTSAAADTIEGLHWDVTGTINSKLRRYVAYMQIVDTTAIDFTSADRTKLELITGTYGAKIDYRDVAGNLPAQVKAQDNIDFGALQKASLNAATPSVTVSDKTGFSLSATGADLILKSSTFIQAIAAAINEFATYGLTALNTLLVTTGIKAASIPAATLAANQHVIVDSGTVTNLTNAPTDMALNSTVAKEATLGTVAGYIDTEITSIKNKTDLIPASPAATGAKMDLVDVPNATAITAIQNGLATTANQTTINNNILALPAAVWAVTTRTLSSFGSLVADVAAAVWAYATRTISGVSSSISYPVLSGSLRQDYITAMGNLVGGSDLPLGETEQIFAINQAIKTYSTARPRYVVEDEDGNGTIDYLLVLLADWSDGFSVIKAIEYPVDDDEAAVNVLQDDAWQIYQKPTGKCLRFLENTPSTSEDIRVAYTSLHVCTDDACTIPVIDEGAVQMLAAAGFCDMLATYYAQTSDSVIQADSVDHKSKASEYASRARTYRQQYLNHLGIKEGSVVPASVTRDQDAKTSHGLDGMTHRKKFR